MKNYSSLRTITQLRARVAGLEGAQEQLINDASILLADLVIERAEMQEAIMTLQVKLETAERTIAKLNDELVDLNKNYGA